MSAAETPPPLRDAETPPPLRGAETQPPLRGEEPPPPLRGAETRSAGRGSGAVGPVTTGDAIVEGLVAHDVDTVFAIPGVQTYELFDALARRRDEITVYGARHEQATAYMAFGYAQATGRPGVFSVVPGPGVLNASAAVLTAYGASAPLVGLTGEIPSAYMGRGLGHLHEMPDQLATMRTFTKWSSNIDHPTQAPGVVAEAFHQATSGRPRPVMLAAPWDVLGWRATVAPCVVRPVEPMAPDLDAVDRAAELLRNAKRPMIMVGGGAREASAEVLALAERLQAPVVSFRGGRGVVSDTEPLGLTCAEGFELWSSTDLVLGIGSRMELAWFRWPAGTAPRKTIVIDVDPLQHVRLAPDVALLGDAALTSCALEAALAARSHRASDRTAELLELKAAKRAEIAVLQPHVELLAAIRRALPDDGILVEEICQIGFASYFGYEVRAPRTFITCGHQGTLGFGFPTSLGVKAAYPDRAVVSINGDGGFGFGLQELATAVQHQLGVVAVVFDNGAFGNVLTDQERLFDGRSYGSVLRNPNWVALARAFGAGATTAESPDQLELAIRDALSQPGPTVIVVPTSVRNPATPWRWLMPKRP